MYAKLSRRFMMTSITLYGMYKVSQHPTFNQASSRLLNQSFFSSMRPMMSKPAECEAAQEIEGRPYLGCSLRSMVDKEGMMVLLVNTESPAWHAGLKVGDIILEIDGIKINNISDYYAALVNGQRTTKIFKVSRSGDERLFEVNFKGQNSNN